jgi:hypothetical protein
MATDPELNWSDPESEEVWAPVHAWRALGQLHAEAAAEPLLEYVEIMEETDDWGAEELPEVLAMIGPATLPGLESLLADTSLGLLPHMVAARAISRMPEQYPETRATCIDLLRRTLENIREADSELNGWIVAFLIDLEAVEAAPAIERAFAAGVVDECVASGWEHVQWELGLVEEAPDEEVPEELLDEEPEVFSPPSSGWGSVEPDRGNRPTPKQRAEARRKQAKKDRKRKGKKK